MFFVVALSLLTSRELPTHRCPWRPLRDGARSVAARAAFDERASLGPEHCWPLAAPRRVSGSDVRRRRHSPRPLALLAACPGWPDALEKRTAVGVGRPDRSCGLPCRGIHRRGRSDRTDRIRAYTSASESAADGEAACDDNRPCRRVSGLWLAWSRSRAASPPGHVVAWSSAIAAGLVALPLRSMHALGNRSGPARPAGSRSAPGAPLRRRPRRRELAGSSSFESIRAGCRL